MEKQKKVLGNLIIILLILGFINILLIAVLQNNSRQNSRYSVFFEDKIDDNIDNNIKNNISSDIKNNNKDNQFNNDISSSLNTVIKDNKNNSNLNITDQNNNNGDNNNNNNGNNGNNDNNDDNDDQEYEKTIVVKSEGKIWSQNSELNIFSNKYFNNENIIAPGSTGEYKFIIENRNGKNTSILCNINFNEINEKNINMVYKIKVDGQYINNDEQWKKISDIKLEDLKIKDNATCSLIWRWEDAQNDTSIGESDNANYKLNITINGVIDEG